jgi:tetratricopeptide (TPR) repeat protein
VQRLLHPPQSDDPAPFVDTRRTSELRLEQARHLLETADAEHSPDVRLRFDLGLVYELLGDTQARTDLYERAVQVLAPALEEAPDNPASTVALERLVYAIARLDRPREELAAWRRYIPKLTDERARAVDMMNMGEAEMRVGLVDDALATFREVIRLCGSLPNTGRSTYVLAMWDLAVALDRSGDPRGALAVGAKAAALTTIGPSGLPLSGRAVLTHDPDVFFAPAWEREWYLALSSSALASVADDARDSSGCWANAEAHWDAYIGPAGSAGRHDPWLPIARLRREVAHASRVAAEGRAAKLPPRGPFEQLCRGD